MSKLHNETMQQKLGSIKSGARIFGIIGRLSMFVGLLGVAIYAITLATQGAPRGEFAAHAAMYLVYGWLFLKARDAFSAIEALIQEMGEII